LGFMKDMKDMKEAVAGAPTAIADAQQAQTQAQQLMAARSAAQHAETAQAIEQLETALAASAASADLTPVAGVSLEQYASIAKGLADVGFDQSRAAGVAGSRGVSATSWDEAREGWNARIVANASIARQFNQHYLGA
jgi:hypothetical protein